MTGDALQRREGCEGEERAHGVHEALTRAIFLRASANIQMRCVWFI
jgi:hypothetical protein